METSQNCQDESKRRKQRIKKLQKIDKMEDEKKRLSTTPGQRVFNLPQGVKPLSLFIRMGALQHENDEIPFEYISCRSSEDLTTYDVHPEVIETRKYLHLGDEDINRHNLKPQTNRRPSSIQFPMPSALRKREANSDTNHSRRPQSLRILDPKDMRTYSPVCHSEFIKELHEEQLKSLESRLALSGLVLKDM